MNKSDILPKADAIPTNADIVSIGGSGLSLTETRYLLHIKPSLDRLSKADPSNVQEIVASQIELMSVYHNEVLDQARKSFRAASLAAIAGFSFFLIAITLFLLQQSENVAILSTVSGVIIEVISAISFYLYRKTSAQMADFQSRLDTTQRFLLANSICEGLDGEPKQKARSELVQAIAGIRTTIGGSTQDSFQPEHTPS